MPFPAVGSWELGVLPKTLGRKMVAEIGLGERIITVLYLHSAHPVPSTAQRRGESAARTSNTIHTHMYVGCVCVLCGKALFFG